MADAKRIERFLARREVQGVFRLLTRQRRDGGCLLGDFFAHYAGEKTPFRRRPFFLLPSLFTDYVRRKAGGSRETLRNRVFGHVPTRRALINTIRSVGRFGLERPQRWAAPLLAVWNFTQACNLKCIHCYQDARSALPDELDLPRQKAILDDLRANDTSWLAFSGGEPLMGRHFWAVAEHAGKRDFYTSVATNGTLLTRETCRRLVEVGVKYAEISLDSVDPAVHDRFRGGRGYWERAVRGIENAVAQEGLRVSIAATVTRLNLDELPRLIDFAAEHGANTFYAFNFIPTGRAVSETRLDLTPEMREEMLGVLQSELNANRLSIMTSCPQMGRVCMMKAAAGGRVNTGHYGAGNAAMVGVMAAYVGGCGAGRCYIAIQPNGLVTPCVFMSDVVIGDFRRQRLRDFWFDHPVLEVLRDRNRRSGHCRECAYRWYCGGCRARAWGYFRDLTRSDPGCIANAAEWVELQGRSLSPAVHGREPPGRLASLHPMRSPAARG